MKDCWRVGLLELTIEDMSDGALVVMVPEDTEAGPELEVVEALVSTWRALVEVATLVGSGLGLLENALLEAGVRDGSGGGTLVAVGLEAEGLLLKRLVVGTTSSLRR